MKDDLAASSEITVAADAEDAPAVALGDTPRIGLADGLITLLTRAGIECSLVATESCDNGPLRQARPLTVH